MSDTRGQRLGRMIYGRFVPDYVGSEGETTEHLPDGYVDPIAVRERYAQTNVVDEQLATIEHVLASVDVSALTWDQITKLTTVNEAILELYKAAILARMSGAS
jgi:hypothetical protein